MLTEHVANLKKRGWLIDRLDLWLIETGPVKINLSEEDESLWITPTLRFIGFDTYGECQMGWGKAKIVVLRGERVTTAMPVGRCKLPRPGWLSADSPLFETLVLKFVKAGFSVING